MKNTIKLLVILTFFSCNYKNNKCEDLKKTMDYLEKYKTSKDSTFYKVEEIDKKITFLERKTGIKAVDQGNFVGRYIIYDEDMSKWKEWIENNCK